MKGSAAHQIKILYQKSGIDAIGESKHAAKAIARENIATGSNRSATWHEIGKKIGIHSFATQNAYRDTWRHVLQHAKAEFGIIKDIEKITGEHVAAYLQSKIDQNVKHATFMQYAAAIEKLETALNMYSQKFDRGKTYSFSQAIKSVRAEAHEKLERFSGQREYKNPEKIIEKIENETYEMVARLQLQAGLRIKETNMITASQLLPGNRLQISGKGGKIRILTLPADLHRRLQAAVTAAGVMSYSKSSYRRALAKAATATGEIYKGKSTHGLRWSYAQTKFQEYQRSAGETYEQAEQRVSTELGHNRPDTTQHYLGH